MSDDIFNTIIRMQADIEHFRSKLGKINGASEVGDKLLELVQAKTTAAPAPAPAPEPEAEPESENTDQGNDAEAAET
jgi:vacuolar protein sorting-associated protein 54